MQKFESYCIATVTTNYVHANRSLTLNHI